MKKIARLFILLFLAVGAFAQTPVTGAPTGVIARVAPALYSSTSSTSLVTIFTPPAAGQYRLSCWMQETVAGTAGTFQIQFNTVSDGHTTTLNCGGTVTTTSQWAQTQGVVSFYADAGVAVQWIITAASVTGTPTIRYTLAVEKLQ